MQGIRDYRKHRGTLIDCREMKIKIVQWMSFGDYERTVCNCKHFGKDLLKFFVDTDLTEHLLLQNFEVFLKQHSSHIYEANNISEKLCFQDLCTTILKLKNQDILNGTKLLTKIVDIISLMMFQTDQCVLFSLYSKGLFSLFRHSCHSVEIVRISEALEGKSEYMKLLVNLDLLSSLNIDCWTAEDTTKRIVKEFMWNVCNIIGYRVDDGGQYIDNGEGITVGARFAHSKIKDILNGIRYLYFRENKTTSFQRIHITMIAIRASYFKLSKKENIAKEFIYCLRMYFTTTRDPLITINEVRSMLYVSLNVLEKLHLFESLYEEFLKIMPECSTKLEPRSLTDLARCQIRETIKKWDLHLPAAVAQLNLAQPLKEFLLGNVIQMSRMNVNISPEHIITKLKLDEIMSERTNFDLSQYRIL